MHPKRTTSRLLIVLIAALLVIVAAPTLFPRASGSDASNSAVTGIYRGESPVVNFDVSPPLRDIPPATTGIHDLIEIMDEWPSGLEGPLGPQDADGALQNYFGDSAGEIPSPSAGFDGPSNSSGVQPPDPVGDVGPNHYVAMSNLSFAVYSKTGTLLYGPVANNTLWSGFGGACQNENAGDPVVVYDQFADRWILTQFTANGPTYYNCVAISTSGDPTGSYYRYAVSTGSNFPDYPKYGVWSDAYLISTREFAGSTFAGVGAYALNRSQMIAGNPSPQIISFIVPPGTTSYNVGDGLLPADIDGNTLPPGGSPAYYVGSMDNGGPYGAPQDALTLWKFTINWASPSSSTFVLANTIPVAAFDSMFPCGTGGRSCISQPGTTNKIDVLSYRQRPTNRLVYRNFGTHEVLLTSQSVEASTSVAGMRWWEIRSPNSSPVIYQQGTYSPDSVSRWMGSIAMDQNGNIALGYSAGSSTVYPSLRYTARLSTDPLGTMPQGEGVFFAGTGSQTSGQRWGDYSSLNLDPVDDCTFWYVNEYLPTNGSNWRLRIGAFKLDSCTSGPTPTPGPTNTATATPTPTNTPAPPTSTGYLSPSANAAVTSSSGDNNGFETTPANAYADDTAVAVDTNSGTNNQTSCTSSRKDRHVYYNYNVSVPGGATINGIEVRLDARADSTSGTPRFCVQLSWDGGVTWTTAKTSANLTTTEATYILGGPADTWGRLWATGELSNTNFRVRIVSIAASTARDFYLDYIAVNVYYTP
jgi:hypothetical protein